MSRASQLLLAGLRLQRDQVRAAWFRHRLRRHPERALSEAVVSIRQCFAWFGLPLDDITDDEVEHSIVNFVTGLVPIGITSEEATTRLVTLVRSRGAWL